jgi:DNA-binding transcriptional LysR family regulator
MTRGESVRSKASLDDLAAFAAVARACSFTQAAAELRLSTSALSHTVKGLEARLGVRLLQRNSRSVSVTIAGERLLQTLAPALSEIESALGQLDQERDVVSGLVRLTATRHAFETVIRPVLPRFLADHPQAQVEVVIDYQLRDIIEEKLDAGIRIGEKLEKDMIAVRVGSDMRMAVVASPGYLANHPAPQTPQDLTAHRCINQRMLASGQTYDWEFEREGRELAIKVTGPLTYNEPGVMLEAALDGLGVAYLIEDHAAAPLADGRLVRLLDEWTPPFPGYFLYHSSRRQMPPALAALIVALRRGA